MKKTKQTTAAKADENNKNVRNGTESAPSDIRVKDGGERELDFKKVLYGYDPDEVKAYIDDMAKSHGAAVRNYESRLSSVKEELLLSNRERDSLSEKFKKYQAAATDGIVVQPDDKAEDKSEQYKQALIAMQERLEQAKAENALLEKRNRELQAANEAAEEVAKKYDVLVAESKEILAQKEMMIVEVSEKEKIIQALSDEIEQKKDRINDLSLEAEEAKRAVTDLEIKIGVLARQYEEKEEENSSLKEQNKAQAYDYAEKLNKLESEQAQSKLAAQKDMQLREYFINRAELTLAELTKQMEQIKQSFSDTHDV